ncbi:MAG TPA: adenylate/guanylate cyclase domain-containing protein [Methylomirabilota bacterium]|jgi:adenylate cyclase|nr:adenylate/guanylate cyclase domain-containing protein [Methylomirabilota bacterium]
MPEPEAGRGSRIRLPLKLKLGLLITALLVVTVTFLSAFLLYRAEKSLTAQMTKRGLTIAQHLANAARNPLLTNDGLTLNLLVKDAMKDEDVAYVIIADHDGKVVAHTDVNLIGRRVERITELTRLGEDPLIQTYTDPEQGRIMDFAIPLTFRKVPVGAIYLGFSQKSIGQALAQARNQTIAISVVMILIGIGGAVVLAGLLARPILRLVEGTRAIAEGDFTVTLAVPSRDEIGMLTEAFNLMAKNLREKEMIKRAFARYVAREVVEELLKDPERLVLTGERREVTVLFCDMRGFTALSERMSPEEVVMLLNDFYDLMIEATFRHEGTLDKFLGDAVMAVFGAPIAHPDHTIRAVRTAVAMREGIERLSAQRIRAGKEPLTVGVGVSTGEAVAGTVGTQDRMEYTVIGDSVNLAARLESNAKSMQILMSGRTYRDVKEHVEARPLGVVKVKGKEEDVEVYEVLRLK